LGMPGLRNARTMLATWYKCDGEIIIGMLSPTLHELGIVALGYQQADLTQKDRPINPAAFMLTDLAAAVLATEAEPSHTVDTPTGSRTLIVHPNFELLLLQPDLPTLYSLLSFPQINHVGIVSPLTLTPTSLFRVLHAN